MNCISPWHLEQKYKKYGVLICEFPDHLYLAQIKIPSRLQGKGIGTKIMRDICGHMDKWRRVMTLYPSPNLGSDPERLRAFYGRFGFVPDKKCPKEMIRQPKRSTSWKPITIERST